MNQTTRYSEAFKKQIVDQIAGGKFPFVYPAQKAYQIGGAQTWKLLVNGWLCRRRSLKKTRVDALGRTQETGAEMNLKMSIQHLCKKLQMSRQNDYKERTQRRGREIDAFKEMVLSGPN